MIVPPILFSIDQGELVIRTSRNNELLWKGKPNGVDVELALPIPNTDDLIVLLNWLKAAEQSKKNLLRLGSMGDVIWEVDSPPKKTPPGPDRDLDVYTGVIIKDEIVIAYAFSGYSDQIDIQTGKIIKWEFVK